MRRPSQAHVSGSAGLDADRFEGASVRHQDLVRDLAFSLRLVGRERRLAATIVLVLALGVAADATALMPVRRILWAPLPFPRPERLVLISSRYQKPAVDRGALSPPGLLELAGRRDLFAGVGGFARQRFDLATEAGTDKVFGAAVTSGFFGTLGLRPRLGRLFSPEEYLPGGSRSVVLGDAFWHQRCGGDPAVLGRDITLDGARHRVVGVLPAGVGFPDGAEVWTADALDPRARTFNRGNEYLTAVGRLRARPLGEVQAALAVMGEQLRGLHAEVYGEDSGYSLAALPLHDVLVERVRPVVVAAFLSLSLVLLIAAANTAALCFARVLARRGELELRAALGARPGEVVRQVAIENGLVLGAAFLLGAALVPPASRLAARVLPIGPAATDLSWLPWLAGAFLGCLLLVALPPALYAGRLAARARPVAAAWGGRTRGTRRATGLLIALEACFAFALLQSTTLVVASARHLRSLPLGFEPGNVLIVKARPLERDVADDAHLLQYQEDLLGRVRQLPGIVAASTVSTAPLTAGTFRLAIPIRSVSRAPLVVQCELRVVSADYFRTLRIAILDGREVTDADDERGERVAVVDTRLVSLLGPGSHPLAAELDLGGPRRFRVVGVAAAVRQALTAEGDPPPLIYVPFRQFPLRNLALALRLKPGTRPATALAALRLAVARVNRRQPLFDAATLEQLLDRAMTPSRSAMWILSALSVVAWILLAAGVQGITAYRVRQSRLELGVRSVLGARPADLLSLAIGRCLASLAVGIGAGALLGSWLCTALAGVLFGVAPWELGSYGLAAVGVAATAVGGVIAASLREVYRPPAVLLSDVTR
jgi:putative ABC transport system permease protein